MSKLAKLYTTLTALLFLSIFIIQSDSIAQATVINETEINDSMTEARSHDAIGYDNEHLSYKGRISDLVDQDYFVMYVNQANTKITFNIKNNDTIEDYNCAYDFEVINSDGRSLDNWAYGIEAGGSKTIVNLAEETGIYYFLVTNSNSNDNNGCSRAVSYSFNIQSNRPLSLSEAQTPNPDPQPNPQPNPQPEPETDPTPEPSACQQAQSNLNKAKKVLKHKQSQYRKKHTAARKRAVQKAKRDVKKAISQANSQCPA